MKILPRHMEMGNFKGEGGDMFGVISLSDDDVINKLVDFTDKIKIIPKKLSKAIYFYHCAVLIEFTPTIFRCFVL